MSYFLEYHWYGSEIEDLFNNFLQDYWYIPQRVKELEDQGHKCVSVTNRKIWWCTHDECIFSRL